MGKYTLYHGSYTRVQNPLVKIGRKDLDFGQGFYTTAIKEQAVKWAAIMQQRHKECETAYLNAYELNLDAVISEGYKFRRFEKYDVEWLNFIVDNRMDKNAWREYDIVEGGIANDSVIDTVDAYMSGLIGATTAIGRLIYNKPNNQVCILNQAIIDKHLKFIGCEEIKE